MKMKMSEFSKLPEAEREKICNRIKDEWIVFCELDDALDNGEIILQERKQK
jgi:hypothetical protein